MSNRKTGLQALPSEIIRKIVETVDERHPLLLTCRVSLKLQTSLLSSEHIYQSLLSGEEERQSEDGYIPPLEKLIEGLQHDSTVEDAPLGRDAKLCFLQHTKKLQHSFGTYICFRESSSDEKVLERITHTFQSLHKQSIVAFPNLIDLKLYCTGWSSITPPNRTCAFALASVSQPRVCYWPFLYGLDELQPLPLDKPGEMAMKGMPYQDLNFAKQHMPERVIHLPYKAPCIPIVCYGTLNVVSYSQLWSFPAWSVGETVNYLISILRYAHPEMFTPQAKAVVGMSTKERVRRDKTSWAFLWVGRFTKKDGETYAMMMKKVEVGLYDGVPMMRNRLKFCVDDMGR